MPLPFETVKRDIIVKREGVTNPTLGRDPAKRPLSELIQYGITVINKPRGPTSHQVSDYAQRILGITKAGHGGTLDPNVTGVLPVALGRATRIVQALLPAGKEYVCIMHLHKPVAEKALAKTLKQFVGDIQQLPPIKSAVKRQLRTRTIYYLDVLEVDGQDVLFRVGCQAGTYIRKLCTDIGKALGCGAHMAQLVRTKAGPFSTEQTVTLQDLADAYHYAKEGKEGPLRRAILPVEMGVTHLSRIWIQDSAIPALCHGRDLAVPGISKLHNDINPGDLVAILSLKEELVCIGEARMTSVEMSQKARGIAVRTDKVFMSPGTYQPISPSPA